MTAVDSVHERRRWYALVLLCSAQFVVVLDASVINVALPAIGQDLGAGQRALTWVVSAYVLAFGGFLLLGGRLADLLGRRRLFVSGLLLFGIASLAGGFADSVGVLVTARVVQGLGAAVLSPSAMSIIAVTFSDGAERNKAFAAWGAVGGAGGAAGVILSGVLTQYAGWEWVLWINVPVVVACVLLVRPLLAGTRAPSGDRVFDLAGAATVTAALTLLVYTLVEAPRAGAVQLFGSLLGVLVLLAAFVAIERRSRAPLVDLATFRLRTLTGANVAGILTGGVVVTMFFFLSLLLQNVLGYDAITTGLSLVPMCLVSFGIALGLASALVTKHGYKPVLTGGLALFAAGLAWLSLFSPGDGFVFSVLAPELVAGAGLGLVFAPLFVAASTGVGWQQAGLASGLINTSQQLGGALGLAVVSAVAFTGDTSPEGLARDYGTAFLSCAVIAALGVVATAFLIRSSDSRDHAELSRAAEPVA
ncbi:MFS transporter [Amycolatopsis sp. CA-230715]|uniref:MFS transporter n=1 Tax=Amycolatopsis sp. CA-230715 TaxID=2745196 RepID=UPI001C02440D|nr:MFS transporter [Amycolatopsis sp. CA-230715]QWF78225.1 putative MFS-type transporter EfpA [Amycolatopsis sp. CA-230715]